jgi:hypothetical protein
MSWDSGAAHNEPINSGFSLHHPLLLTIGMDGKIDGVLGSQRASQRQIRQVVFVLFYFKKWLVYVASRPPL